MAEIKLTPSQQAVVSDRGGQLLVSAAAGSGKTKVLIDRLLARICDPDTPCNLDQFLVITYTNAAAAELRLKITQAINERLAKEPSNRHLQHQLHRIYLADISTVHAFCANLLRTYAYLLDLPADFRMAEELESTLLQEKVLNRLLEQAYEEGDPEFLLMVDTFGYGRDDRRLPEAVQMAYRAMRCRVNMQQWLKEMFETMDLSQYQDISETPWGIYLIRSFRNFLSQKIASMQEAKRDMQFYPLIQKGLETIFEKNIEQMQALLEFTCWDDIVAHKIDSFGRAGAIREPEDPAVKDRLVKVRQQCWAELKSWQTSFSGTSSEILADLQNVMPAAKSLLNFTQKFDQAYTEEKKHRKILDFSDLEHQAIRLLVDRYTGQPTKIAREISKKYVEIMVDEYQDSNQVQDVIFEAVSKDGRNRFMVGDVKQSIYRFRLADPTLFLDKYESYPLYTEAKEGEPRKILLSENFRSRPEILAACNDVFGLIMRKQVGDLNYGEAEALHPGRVFPPVEVPPVELHCLTNTSDESSTDKREQEAQYVARRIRDLLETKTQILDGNHTRPARPSDIVILLRSLSNTVPSFLHALQEEGIPAVCSREGNLLDTTEIQILVSMLEVIDNPHQDVPLLTVLASPLFGISPEILAEARASQKRMDVFDCIQRADGSFHAFLVCLDALRTEAKWISLHELIDLVFTRTKITSIFSAMNDGEKRLQNLHSFRNFAASFERSGSRSLTQLLWYLHDLQADGEDLPAASMSSENAVTIMSIHKSKGLEFPIVVLSDLSHQFSKKDMQEAILVDDVLAVGCNCVDHDRYVRYPTIAKKSIERKKKQESLSEELRILYVAMTRAKEKLIMTYYSKRLLSELTSINSQLTMPLSDDLCASANNPGKWILMAALCRTEAGALLNLVDGNDISRVQEYPWKIVYKDLCTLEDPDAVVTPTEMISGFQDDSELLKQISTPYPYAYVSDLPSKVTATTLKGRFQDREVAEQAREPVSVSAYKFRKAIFSSHQMTPAEKGIATHLFMQFAKYEFCTTEEQFETERKRLIDYAFMTLEQANAVQKNQILQFFSSDLGKWLLAQKDVKREFKFSVFQNAGIYDARAEGEQIMLQGVVDCFVIERDGITIIDFKTDQIKTTPEARTAHYLPQMEAYARALQEIYQLPVKKRILYFFSCGKAVCI